MLFILLGVIVGGTIVFTTLTIKARYERAQLARRVAIWRTINTLNNATTTTTQEA